MIVTISPWPLVRRGDRDHPVRSLQDLLRARGREVRADGVYGPRTEAAVRSFQRSKGLAVDGVAGPATWAALVLTVSQGNRGDAVRAVQEEFRFRNETGDPDKGLKVDGIFGPETTDAVRSFQHALHMDTPFVVVDGVVGPITWRALVGGMLSF
jgi:peptidoglycan hydrolase-like protein with peptidoglycan-binding domain